MKNLLIAAVALAALPVLAQHQGMHSHHGQPYAGMETREIKALSADEIAGLEAGAGMGLAQAAELNRYPGPKHVLELSSELELTPEQIAAANKAFDDMKASAVEIGSKIIDAERHLDQAFATGSIDEESLARMTSHIGQLRGDLRAVHLRAHLTMKAILSADQVARYAELRGYGSSGSESR